MTTALNDFVRQVDQACADLPEPQRRKLVVDLEDHLRELDADAIAELGDPAAYAAELRAALDLPTARPVPAHVPAYPPAQYPPAQYPPQKSGLSTWIIVALCVVGSGLIMVVLFAALAFFGLAATSQHSSGPGTGAPVASAVPIPMVQVPNLVGGTQAKATESAQAVGLDVRVEVVASNRPKGEVVAQSPAAFSQVQQGTTVVLQVSSGR